MPNKVLDNAWFVSLLLITVPLVTNLSGLVNVFGLHERSSAIALFAAVALNAVASVLAATFRFVIFRRSMILNGAQATGFIVSCLTVVAAAGVTLYYYLSSSNIYISLPLYIFSIVVLLVLKPKRAD